MEMPLYKHLLFDFCMYGALVPVFDPDELHPITADAPDVTFIAVTTPEIFSPESTAFSRVTSHVRPSALHVSTQLFPGSLSTQSTTEVQGGVRAVLSVKSAPQTHAEGVVDPTGLVALPVPPGPHGSQLPEEVSFHDPEGQSE